MKIIQTIFLVFSTVYSFGQIENGKYESEDEYIHFINDSVVNYQLINLATVDPTFEIWTKNIYQGQGRIKRLDEYLIVTPCPDTNIQKKIVFNNDSLIIKIIDADGKAAMFSILKFYNNDSLAAVGNTDVEGCFYSSPINSDSLFIQADPTRDGCNFSSKIEGFNTIEFVIPTYLFDNRNLWVFRVQQENNEVLDLILINHFVSEFEFNNDPEIMKYIKKYYRNNKSYYSKKYLIKKAANKK